ncbi:MAG: tetratricopeptide repeat protein [Myxococcota bacterium]|nr:tetratricopeptide repeat protein [Myxococcota bacterium]
MRFTKSLKIIHLIVIGALFLGTAACQSDAEKLDGFLESGNAALDAEEFEEAVIEFRNVLQLDPNHAEAHYALARSYTKLQKLKEAYWELHESVRLDPSNTDARVSFAQFSLIAKDYEEVLTQAEAIIESDPTRASAYTLQADAYSALERYEEAEASFIVAVENSIEEDLSVHLSNLVQFLSRIGRPRAARPYLDRMIEVDPSSRSYGALGRHLTRLREPEGAEAAFKKALELAKEGVLSNTYRNLAGFYFNETRFDEAVATLEKGIETVEDSEGRLELIYLLARFHSSQGNDEEADRLVEKATETADDDPEPWLVLSSFRGRQGDMDGALAAVDKALEVEPDNKGAQLRKAELLVDTGYREKDEARVGEGRAIIDEVLTGEPSNPDALFVRAKVEMAELDPKAAAQTLRAALDVRPDWAQARFVLGTALMLLGDQNGARAELARAVELDPAQLEARSSLARIHAALGEHEYAIEQGRIYLRERPADTRTQILVAQSLVNLGKRDEAFEELKKISDDRRDADAWYAIGRLYMVQGKLELASEALSAALVERPNHPDILRSLHRIDVTLGRTDESAARIRAAVAADPENAGLALLEGNLAYGERDFAAAEAAYQRAVELDPDNTGAYQRLAMFYRATDRLDDAISTFQASLAKNPNSARLHERLAILFEVQGQVEEAMEHYDEAIALDSSLGEAKNNLAYLLAEQGGDLDRALDLAQEAKALLPDSPNTADTLGWVLFKRGIPSAAIGYLREAVNGFSADPGSLGAVSHHLALAYEANEQKDKALEALEVAIGAADTLKANSGQDPGWAADVREMASRLRAS